MNAFVASEVDRPAASGWRSCAPIAALVRDRRLPAITREYLLSEFSPDEWQRVSRKQRRHRPATSAQHRGIGSARIAPTLLV
ncbi:hypothetical protein OG558_02325 [Kribbella sp. NBC_01510]|uniref:hypothetical protein n=1 Tax=Kribbella sp. NBC_01510 TaxID=2903581 RepID=UPI00386FB1F3